MACLPTGDGKDFAWLLARADEQAVGVAKLFAHIGLRAIDDFAGERHGQAYVDYKARAISLPESKIQVQMLLTRYFLATPLNCLARYLPSAISQPALSIDDLLVQRLRAAQVRLPRPILQSQHRAALS